MQNKKGITLEEAFKALNGREVKRSLRESKSSKAKRSLKESLSKKELDKYHKDVDAVTFDYTTREGEKVKVIQSPKYELFKNEDGLMFIDDILDEHRFVGSTFDLSFINDDGDGNFLIDGKGYCWVGYPERLYPVEDDSIRNSMEIAKENLGVDSLRESNSKEKTN